MRPVFDPTKQCHWCGSADLDTTLGYAGERACRVCGWGGDGEPDVPCMFYKLALPAPNGAAEPPAARPVIDAATERDGR
jgi:hypothetical protein